MAGLLQVDPTHHGMAGNRISGSSQDKLVAGARWYLSRKEIEENSPSRRDGIDLKKETYLRKSYCTFLQDLGMRLKVPQVTIATAIIFCHRFFLRQSHMKNDRRTIATVCMFLAGKVEETPRPLKDVILVSYEIINKKDPDAVHRIKQKEVYEQQKELILLGERLVLTTLGFDLNVNHPYKPLVEAIKKFKVAQNALAQVAWNFVNDGLRTSLCLQFKAHHIAAGAIFLAAKFLKVKLPSDGEKVWWQEFDVTPRQLEEVSNQMLELYEQNRMPASQGSEVEGNGIGGTIVQGSNKNAITTEESLLVNGYSQAGGMPQANSGASLASSTRPTSEQSNSDNQGGSHRITQNQGNEQGSTEARSLNSEHKPGDESEGHYTEQDSVSLSREIEQDTSNGSNRSEQLTQENQKGWEKNETRKAEELKNETSSFKSKNAFSQSPPDAIKMIEDKVKAAREKRKKAGGEVTRKVDLTDEDDLIERELEDGIVLAVGNEKSKQDRWQSWTKLSNKAEDIVDHGKESMDKGDFGEGRSTGSKGKSSWETSMEHVEEGELSISDDAGQGLRSPELSNRKRKVVSPDKHLLEGKQQHDYKSGFLNHQGVEGSTKMSRYGLSEREHERDGQENHV